MFNHDDTVNDRTPGSKLSESDAKTRQLWREHYKVGILRSAAQSRYCTH